MAKYVYDHIHLRTRDPEGMAEYFHKMFDARVIESVQSDGRPRVDLDIDGLIVRGSSMISAPRRFSSATVSSTLSTRNPKWSSPR